LGVVAAVLAITVVASLLSDRRHRPIENEETNQEVPT